MQPGNTSLQAVASINCRGAYKQVILEQRNIQHDRKRYWIPYKPMENKEGNQSYSGEILIERADGLFQTENNVPVVRSCLNGMPFMTKRQRLGDIQDDVAYRGICKTDDGEEPVCIISGLVSMINNGKFPFKRGDTVCGVFPDPNQAQPKRKTMQTQPYHLTTPNLSTDALNTIVGSPDMTKLLYTVIKLTITLFSNYMKHDSKMNEEAAQERRAAVQSGIYDPLWRAEDKHNMMVNETLFGVKGVKRKMIDGLWNYVLGASSTLEQEYIDYAFSTGIDKFIDLTIGYSLDGNMDTETTTPNIASASKIAISLFQKCIIAYAQDHHDIAIKDIITPLFNVAQNILAKSNNILGVCQSNGLPGERIDVFLNPSLKTQAIRTSIDSLRVPNIHNKEMMRDILSKVNDEFQSILQVTEIEYDNKGNLIPPPKKETSKKETHKKEPPKNEPPKKETHRDKSSRQRIEVDDGQTEEDDRFKNPSRYEMPSQQNDIQIILDSIFNPEVPYESKRTLISRLDSYQKINVKQNLMVSKFVIASLIPLCEDDVMMEYRIIASYINCVHDDVVRDGNLKDTERDEWMDNTAQMISELQYGKNGETIISKLMNGVDIHFPYRFKDDDIFFNGARTTKYAYNHEHDPFQATLTEQFGETNTTYEGDFKFFIDDYVANNDMQVYDMDNAEIIGVRNRSSLFSSPEIIVYLNMTLIPWLLSLSWVQRKPWLRYIESETPLNEDEPNETYRYLIYIKEKERIMNDLQNFVHHTLNRNAELRYEIMLHLYINVFDYINATDQEYSEILPIVYRNFLKNRRGLATTVTKKSDLHTKLKVQVLNSYGENVAGNVVNSMSAKTQMKRIYNVGAWFLRNANVSLSKAIIGTIATWFPCDSDLEKGDSMINALSSYDEGGWHILSLNIIRSMIPFYGFILFHDINAINISYEWVYTTSVALNKAFIAFTQHGKSTVREYRQKLREAVGNSLTNMYEGREECMAEIINSQTEEGDIIHSVMAHFLRNDTPPATVHIEEHLRHKITPREFKMLVERRYVVDTTFLVETGNKDTGNERYGEIEDGVRNLNMMLHALNRDTCYHMFYEIAEAMNRQHNIYNYMPTNHKKDTEITVNIILQYPDIDKRTILNYLHRNVETNVDDPRDINTIVPLCKPFEKFLHTINMHMLKVTARNLSKDDMKSIEMQVRWCHDPDSIDDLLLLIGSVNTPPDVAKQWLINNPFSKRISSVYRKYAMTTGSEEEYNTLLSDYEKTRKFLREVKKIQIDHQLEFINMVRGKPAPTSKIPVVPPTKTTTVPPPPPTGDPTKTTVPPKTTTGDPTKTTTVPPPPPTGDPTTTTVPPPPPTGDPTTASLPAVTHTTGDPTTASLPAVTHTTSAVTPPPPPPVVGPPDSPPAASLPAVTPATGDPTTASLPAVTHTTASLPAVTQTTGDPTTSAASPPAAASSPPAVVPTTGAPTTGAPTTSAASPPAAASSPPAVVPTTGAAAL